MRISLLLILIILSSNNNSFTDPLPTKATPGELESLQYDSLFNFYLFKKYHGPIDNPASFIDASLQYTSRKQFAETIKDIKEYTESDVFLPTLEKVLHKKIEKIEQIHNYGIDK